MTPTQAERAARRARKTDRKRAAEGAYREAREAFHSGSAHGRLRAERYLAAHPHRREFVETPPILPDWTDEDWEKWVSDLDPLYVP